MYDIFFVILIVVYLIFSILVERWTTFVHLEISEAVPGSFTENNRVYIFIRFLLAFSLILISFFTVKTTWHFNLIIFLIVWFQSAIIGRNRAFNRFREINAELAESEPDKDKKSELIKNSELTNKELKLILFKKLRAEK